MKIIIPKEYHDQLADVMIDSSFLTCVMFCGDTIYSRFKYEKYSKDLRLVNNSINLDLGIKRHNEILSFIEEKLKEENCKLR